MKVYINYGVGISSIDEERTQWCCDEFKTWGHKYKIIEDVGDEPEIIFNWDELEFQTVTHSVMFGNGGFGDRFWGEKISICPFCGKKIERLRFVVNDEEIKCTRKELIKKMER